MQVNKNNITQFLTSTNTCFMIPVYQRNYDWGKENCKDLWNDIWALSQDIAAEKPKTHFIGTICSKTAAGHEKFIIDGQQRITTISLLVKAMHDYVENEIFKHDLDSNFLHNIGYGVKPEHEVKLHLNAHDDDVYNKLLKYNKHVQPENLDEKDIESRIFINYEYFYNCISDLSEDQIGNIRMAFDYLIIVDLDVENENPQEIFESLNSTGLDLTSVDLLRNYLLMSLDYDLQRRLYSDYWYRIEENVRPENMTTFFVDYLIYTKRSDSTQVHNRRAHINNTNLYIAFKNYHQYNIDKFDNDVNYVTESILKDMYECSCYYKYLIFKNDIDMNSLDELNRILYSILNINKSMQSRPVLLYIIINYKSGFISQDQALEMLNACLSYIFRSKVCGLSSINGQFAGNVLNRLPVVADDPDIVDKFWKSITAGDGKYRFPTDKLFKESLINREIFEVLRSNGTKYLLYSLEQNNASSAKGLPRYDDIYISIDHIMPKVLSPEWKEYLGKNVEYHDICIDKLGNLTLTSYNSEMSNNSFEEKKNWFNSSSFAYTRKLSDYTNWTINEITNRSRSLAEKCVRIWPLPDKYQYEYCSKHDESVKKKERRPPFKFSMIDLNEGDEVSFIDDPSKIATVIDDSHVIYDDETYSLSKLASKFLGRKNSRGASGPSYFTYNGQKLDDIRRDRESNLY